MQKTQLPTLLFFLLFTALGAQTPVEGYVFEQNNRGFLNQVAITIYALPDNAVRAELSSDAEGRFACSLPQGRYRLVARKDVFEDHRDTFLVGGDKVFLKMEMRRKPGYLFDATLAEARDNPNTVVDAITGATIEIYNRTLGIPALVLKRHPDAFFQYTFEQGNHYTMLIRKPGYLAKRIEVYVNVKGCILCVDGVQNMTPGVAENLTAGNTMGTLVANIELEKAQLDKRIQVQNIYYDYDKWDIRADAAERLDRVVTLMKDNPGLSVELGSHTDSRGADDYNQSLSQKRAEAAVAYIVSEGVAAQRISAKGYGEAQLSNRCRNGAECSEAEHQQNRRTELRITGISGDSLEHLRWLSLDQIVQNELRDQQLKGQKKVEETAQERFRRLPEANNSVALPPQTPPTKASPSGTKPGKILTNRDNLKYAPRPLPTTFEGYAIEIAKTDKALALERDSILFQYTPIFLRKDANQKNCYFIGDFKELDAARVFLEKTALPRFPNATLVNFRNGKKTYPE
jgi:outer membrane protein OmpA-like peptidoglycan-associated protein